MVLVKFVKGANNLDAEEDKEYAGKREAASMVVNSSTSRSSLLIRSCSIDTGLACIAVATHYRLQIVVHPIHSTSEQT
jgi:hypothetical protein